MFLVSQNLANCITSVTSNQGFNPHEVTDHFPITVQFDLSKLEDAPTPTPVPGPSIAISRLLPNAAGNKSQNEAVWLRNSGPDEIDLTGWRLRDLSNSEWTLGRAGSLQLRRTALSRPSWPWNVSEHAGNVPLLLILPPGDSWAVVLLRILVFTLLICSYAWWIKFAARVLPELFRGKLSDEVVDAFKEFDPPEESSTALSAMVSDTIRIKSGKRSGRFSGSVSGGGVYGLRSIELTF